MGALSQDPHSVPHELPLSWYQNLGNWPLFPLVSQVVHCLAFAYTYDGASIDVAIAVVGRGKIPGLETCMFAPTSTLPPHLRLPLFKSI